MRAGPPPPPRGFTVPPLGFPALGFGVRKHSERWIDDMRTFAAGLGRRRIAGAGFRGRGRFRPVPRAVILSVPPHAGHR